MTTAEIVLMIGFYLILLLVLSYFTRARPRRIIAALAGGAVFGVVGLLGAVLGEGQGWWRISQINVLHFYLLLWLGLAISCVPTYLMVWRIVRRFGGRGLAVCVLVSAIIGPPRDYWIAKMFPAWMTFGPGFAPVLADAIIYALLVAVGYAVMYLVGGPAQRDPLARSVSVMA
jgi:hypothetical protein